MQKPICPSCKSKRVVKRGLRKTATGPRQIYFCKSCSARFTLSPLPRFSYPPAAVLPAPVLFALGYDLREVHAKICGKFKVSPALSTVQSWIKSFSRISAMKRQREAVKKFCNPGKVVSRRLFEHGQRYLLQAHRFKMEAVASEFPALYGYIAGLLNGSIAPVPAEFTLRASSFGLGVSRADLPSRPCYANTLAAQALGAAETNVQRHAALQRAFLALDKATIATELPVFLTRGESLRILGKGGGVLGHIDFVHVFGRTITILDYKPSAARERRAHEQLLLYAIALSVRTGIHLKNIRCAWFVEKDYFGFDALKLYFQFIKNRDSSSNNNLSNTPQLQHSSRAIA